MSSLGGSSELTLNEEKDLFSVGDNKENSNVNFNNRMASSIAG